MPRLSLCALALLLLALPVRPAASGADSAPPPPTYTADVRPLLQAKCGRCHGEKAPKADLDLSSPAGIARGGESGAAVVAGKPDESTLFKRVHEGTMPPGKKDALTAAEVDTLRRWIAAGAKTETAVAEVPPTQHDVIPVMLRHCTACHGRNRREAGLDLRTKAAMLRGGKSGPAIVPGEPDKSLVIRKTRAGQMPPADRLTEACVKPIDKAGIDAVARWIAAGAPEVDIAPDVATTTPDPLVTDKDRDFWAFQPPKPVAVPAVSGAARVRNPIDAFVLARLEAKGLTLSPEADRLTLLRRASFDLTGLPPSPEEVLAFLKNTSPDAYEKAVERLLASPRYGERWGRFWLDLAGYADSEGKREQDLPRPHAWRYRDYVIKSFNADKPYDRFLIEQLAGDELADYETAPEITPELYDNLVATGFLRMAPDATWANITGFLNDRVEVVADEIDVLGSAVMGLTLKCARCHTHKFDPIPHRDYYRLVAVFKGAIDEHDWLKPDVRPGLGPVSADYVGGRLLPFVTTPERKAWEAANAAIDRDIAAIQAELNQKADALAAKLRDERFTKLPAEIRDDVRAALTAPADERDPVQRYLAEKFEPQLRIDRAALPTLDAAFKKESDAANAKLAALRNARPPEPRIQAVWDRGEPSPTYIYRRGDPLTPGKLVGPGVPSVLTDGKTPFVPEPPFPGIRKTGRRLAFAHWLTEPRHPLTARVMVNRVWQHHFGTGIVASTANFGRTGTPPTHPELLDWLATELASGRREPAVSSLLAPNEQPAHAGRSPWSLKHLHRLMMTSATYRQRSTVTPELAKADPANALYSRMPLTRLDAESLYDTLLLAAGKLDETRSGPADAVEVRKDGLVTPSGTAKGWRRLVYVKQTRKQLPTHLETFDFPAMSPNCVERRDSTVAPQALHLLNNAMVERLAESFARRVLSDAGPDRAKQMEAVYLVALSRPPTAEERTLGVAALGKLVDEWVKADRATAEAKALTTYCHALLNSAAFLYVD